MSDFSKWLGDNFGWGPDSPENNAIGDAKQLGHENAALYKQDRIGAQAAARDRVNNVFGDFLGSITSANNSMAAKSGSLGSSMRGRSSSLLDRITGSFNTKKASMLSNLDAQELGAANDREIGATEVSDQTTGLFKRSSTEGIAQAVGIYDKLFNNPDKKEK